MVPAVKPAEAGHAPEIGDGRAERWRAHREIRREHYIDAAIQAIEEHGPDARMEQIAAAAGVAKPKLYRYFADRADLVGAVGDRCGHVVAQRLISAVDLTGSLRATVSRRLDGFLSFVEEQPNTVRFLLNSVGSTGSQNVIVVQGRRISALVAPLFAQLPDSEAAARLAEPLAHTMVGSILGATDWWLLQPDVDRMPREELVDHLSTVVVGAARHVRRGSA